MILLVHYSEQGLFMNKNEIQFLKDRIDNLKNKLEIAQSCLNSAIESLDESDNFMKTIDFYFKKTDA